MASVPPCVIYYKQGCPYSVAAVDLIRAIGLGNTCTVIDLTNQPGRIQKVKDLSGWRTFPVIYIRGQLLGGYSEMKAAYDEGWLEKFILHPNDPRYPRGA